MFNFWFLISDVQLQIMNTPNTNLKSNTASHVSTLFIFRISEFRYSNSCVCEFVKLSRYCVESFKFQLNIWKPKALNHLPLRGMSGIGPWVACGVECLSGERSLAFFRSRSRVHSPSQTAGPGPGLIIQNLCSAPAPRPESRIRVRPRPSTFIWPRPHRGGLRPTCVGGSHGLPDAS